MKLEPKSKLLMIGDSITDVGRARPIGEGRGEELGRGYVAFVDALLGAVHPAAGIRVVNMGTSGNTVRDLKERWQTDVLDLKPDWLSIMIGINDVWRQFDAPKRTELHVYPEEYEKTLRELVVKTRPTLKGLVMMTPFYIELSTTDAMRARMDQYGIIVKKIAGGKRCDFCRYAGCIQRSTEVPVCRQFSLGPRTPRCCRTYDFGTGVFEGNWRLAIQ